MTSFKEIFKMQALVDKLPFQLDFEIRQVTSEVKQTVAGFELPVLNDLTSGESWFLEAIDSLNGAKVSDLSLSLRSLAKKLKIACNLESTKVAVDALFNPSDEMMNSKEYEEFFEVNYQEIDRITELSKLAQDTVALNWLRITFFMLSRYKGSWTLSDTSLLTKKQVESLLDFISQEANQGKSRELTEEATVEDEIEGKN